MEGPIPSTISLLVNLTQLTLRNCLIAGKIPDYIGEMTELKTLDLSFNRLTGEIPGTLQSLSNINFSFLTNDSLTGAVPNWMLSSKQNLDLSYNNLTKSSPTSCQQANVNLVSSFSTMENRSVAWCLTKDLPCYGKANGYSLFINCGGHKIEFEENEYVEDRITVGASNFFFAGSWVYGSTGVFVGDENASYYIASSFGLNVTGTKLYKTARLAPQSLKYYGLCLQQGNYNVTLYFAEIMFTNDQTYSILGRRIFDVSIQGKVVLKDFNIIEAAGGAIGESLGNLMLMLMEALWRYTYIGQEKEPMQFPLEGSVDLLHPLLK